MYFIGDKKQLSFPKVESQVLICIEPIEGLRKEAFCLLNYISGDEVPI